MQVTLFIMTEKGHAVFSYLISLGFAKNINRVIGSRDPNIEKDYYEEIQSLARANNIPFSDRKENLSITTSYAIAISWRWIIPDISQLIVFHDSILPKYRGFAPLVNMLINGESKIGVTALFATKEYDMGDIISISEQSITYPITIQTAIQLITRNYNELAVYVMRKIEAGEQISATPQYKKDGSYSVWLDEEDYHIDWNWNAEKIERFVNAKGYPYAGAFTYVEDKLVRIHHVEVLSPIEIENKTPGKVIFLEDGIPTIVCGHGLIKVLTATYEDGTAFLPLSKFRLRFK